MNVIRTQVTPSNRLRGFTLIELLVVIAIIAILASILFPVFARARENARRSSCSSNLKQIALGIFQYTQDYDERLPRLNGAPFWAETLQPYLKSTQIYQCPSESMGPNIDPTQAGYLDYFYNERMNGSSGVANTLASFTAPAVTIMNGDGPAADANKYLCDVDQTWTPTEPYANRHLDGSNFAFADGHVKWYKASTIEASKGTNPELGKPTFWVTTTGG
jgi:prepilin-type N-terminal cleavage/methylation domain-containing protein/prepilin-type processing-associated H-X9-DG protein